MRSVYRGVLLAAALAWASPAFADGKRDLEDGIAFYENLDTDRALQRLSAASKAGDLPPKDRARAFLYLGMVHFENGARTEAEKAWKSAFDLDKNVEVPKGTSPKAIEAIETARAGTKPPPNIDEPGNKPKDNTTTPEIKKDPTPLPKVTPDVPPNNTQQQQTQQQQTQTQQQQTQTQQTKPDEKKPDLTATTTPSTPDDDDDSTWLWVGAIGAAVIGAAVVGLVVATSGSECEEGGGGCVSVTFR